MVVGSPRSLGSASTTASSVPLSSQKKALNTESKLPVQHVPMQVTSPHDIVSHWSEIDLDSEPCQEREQSRDSVPCLERESQWDFSTDSHPPVAIKLLDDLWGPGNYYIDSKQSFEPIAHENDNKYSDSNPEPQSCYDRLNTALASLLMAWCL